MRTVVMIVMSALLALPVSTVWAQSPAEEPRVLAAEKCSELAHTGRRECLRKLLAGSTVSLKKAEADALAKIAQWFENDRYKNIARTKMRAAGASFGRYREARCARIAALSGGAVGEGRGSSLLACLADMNAERALELKRDTDDLPSD